MANVGIGSRWRPIAAADGGEETLTCPGGGAVKTLTIPAGASGAYIQAHEAGSSGNPIISWTLSGAGGSANYLARDEAFITLETKKQLSGFAAKGLGSGDHKLYINYFSNA